MPVDSPREEKLSKWLALTGTAFVVIAMMVAIAIHSIVILPFTQLVVPFVALLAIQLTCTVIMYWARKRAKLLGDYKPAILAFSAYCLAVLLLAIHYGTTWGLILRQNAKTHY